MMKIKNLTLDILPYIRNHKVCNSNSQRGCESNSVYSYVLVSQWCGKHENNSVWI